LSNSIYAAIHCFKSWGQLAALLLLIVTNIASAANDTISTGAQLPNVHMQGLNGPPQQLSDFRGEPLIINVWASWCRPCRAEMASLERLAWMPNLGSFNVIGISTDDHSAKANSWLALSNATIPHFIDKNLVLEQILGASRIPLTVFVDAEGRIAKKVYGSRTWDSDESLALVETFVNEIPNID